MRRLLPIVLAISVPGCGSDSPSAPTTTTTTLPLRAALTLSFDPDPVLATASGNPITPFSYNYTLIIRETAGVACNVNRYEDTLINPVLNIVVPTRTYGAADVQQLAGTNFIAAGGTLRIPRIGNYAQPGGTPSTGRQVNFRHVVQVIDANGNTINADSTIRVLRGGTASPVE